MKPDFRPMRRQISDVLQNFWDVNKSSIGWNQTFGQFEGRYENFWDVNESSNSYSRASKNCSSENDGTE